MKKILLTLVSALLLCTNFNAWAVDHSGGEIYFDGTGVSDYAYVYACVGHDSYTSLFTMKKISGTNLYHYTQGSWGGAVYFYVIGTTGSWGAGNWGPNNRTNAQYYTNYYKNYQFYSGSYYLVTKDNANNNAAIDISYLGNKDGEYSLLNHNQNITIEGAGSTSITAPYLTGVNATTTTEGTTWVSAAYTSTVTCTATPDEGARFIGWYDASGNKLSTATTYTYTAPHADVAITAKFSEAVVEPTISSFTVTPTEIVLGESVTLNITTDFTGNVIYTYVDNNDESVKGDITGTTWTPDAVGTYTITATLEGTEVSESAEVTVKQPSITSFTASPATITLGETVTLEVTTDTPKAVVYTYVNTTTNEEGTIDASPWEPQAVGVYTITATIEGTEVSESATVTVEKPAPSITSFTATPAEITLGEEVTLTCEVENADEANVVYTVSGETITSPWTPDSVGTYTITASLTDAESKTATVTVNPAPVPAITSFTVSPETITLGEEVTLTCEVENADAADVVYSIDGNKITSPWTPGAVGTYTITATLDGAAESKTATVTVNEVPEVNTWTFYYIGSKDPVYVHVWDKGNDNKNYTQAGQWPGDQMTKNNGTWEYTFTTTDVLSEPMVVFHDNRGNQTGDLELVNGATYNDNGTVDMTQIHTVYFINSNNWDTVYAYVWDKSTDDRYAGDWPGSPCTLVDDNVWKYTIYGSLPAETGVIFNNNNNGSQTEDFTWIDNQYYNASGTTNKPVVETAGFYFVTSTNDNWNECLSMTTTDSITFRYTGPLKGGFKFRLYKNSDNGQYGANADTDLQIEIGKTYGMKSTDSNDAKAFTTLNGNAINVTVEVNRTLNTVRVIPADIYIAGSAVVEKYSDETTEDGTSTGWGVSTIQGCDVDQANGTYTWTGFLYNDNGDDHARFKFLLGSGFTNGGHLIPETAITSIEYGTSYKLSFVWDDASDKLFHSSGFDGMATYDGAAVEGETRVKVKAVVDLTNMSVTFTQVEEENIENLFIAGNATEYGIEGRGALELKEGSNGEALYTAIVNFVNTTDGFLFPTTETALHPALVARENGCVVENFSLKGLDYSFASNPVENYFNVASAGVYQVEVRPDYNSLYVLPYLTTSPADGAYLTVAEKAQTETMTVEFFENVASFDETMVKISPETWWMSYNDDYVDEDGDKKIDARKVVNKGIDAKTVSFGVNSYDGCLTTGETYTITFLQGAVTFADEESLAKSVTERVSPEFSFTVTLAPDTSIGTGVEDVTADSNIAYANGVVTAQGTIVVYNMSGAVVARGEDNLDLNGLNGGVYVVRSANNVLKVVR